MELVPNEIYANFEQWQINVIVHCVRVDVKQCGQDEKKLVKRAVKHCRKFVSKDIAEKSADKFVEYVLGGSQ